MKLVDKLVIKDLLPMFGLGVAMFFSLWFAADPLLKAGKFLSAGIPLGVVIRLVGWNIPPVLALTFPMGMLLAVLLGFGRLSADSESVALFAGGIPFARIAAPALALGLVASGIGYVINDQIASYAQQQVLNLTQNIKQHLGEQGETAQPFDFPVRNGDQLQMLVHVEKGFDLKEKAMRQVTITAFDAQGNPTIIYHAEKARWKQGSNWELINGFLNHLGENMAYGQLGETQIFDLHKNLESTSFLQREPETLNFGQLRRQIQLLRAQGTGEGDETLRNAEITLWSKIAFPFASLVFAIIGAPLGLRPQRTSKYTGWGLAILIIFGYYVLYNVMGSAARSGHVSPFLAAFLPNFLGLGMGAYLTWKAST